MSIESKYLLCFVGWIVALFIEKRYVSRTALLGIVLPASLSMGFDTFFMKFYETSDFSLAWEAWDLPPLLKVYLCIGLSLSLIGLFFYFVKKSLPKKFYNLTYWGYSSKTVHL